MLNHAATSLLAIPGDRETRSRLRTFLARLGRIAPGWPLADHLREPEQVARAMLDALTSNIAVLDRSGTILSVNRAWRSYAAENGGGGPNIFEQADYFAVCDRATGEDGLTAQAFARAIKDVIAGPLPSFNLEYPCHTPGRRRWFVGRVDRIEGDAPAKVVVSHADITDKILAKAESRALTAVLSESAKNLQCLSRRVVEIQEEERRHLARELHDEIGQVLSAISVNLHGAKAADAAGASRLIDESISIVDHATQQVRNLSLDLRPSMLDDLGLVATLRWYADRQGQRAGFIVHFAVESSAPCLSPELTIACFRVMQEALTNVVRHARARHVWIQLHQGDDELVLLVRDDGAGFDPATVRDRAAHGLHLGLLGIQERTALLGGHSEISSQPGDGTSILARFPIALARSTQATPA